MYRTYPVSFDAQFEYLASQATLGGNKVALKTGYNFKNLKVEMGVAERGNYLGDSTEYALKATFFDCMSAAIYVNDREVGMIIGTEVKDELKWVCNMNQNLMSQYVQYNVRGWFELALDVIDVSDPEPWDKIQEDYFEFIIIKKFKQPWNKDLAIEGLYGIGYNILKPLDIGLNIYIGAYIKL